MMTAAFQTSWNASFSKRRERPECFRRRISRARQTNQPHEPHLSPSNYPHMNPIPPQQTIPPGAPETKSCRVTLAMAFLCLILAVVHFHALWPYQLSRWALCAGAIYLLSQSSGWRRGVFAVCAVFYNPIQPVDFDDLWPAVNAITVIALLATMSWDSWRELPRLGKIGASWLVIILFVGGLSAAGAAAILAFFRADDPLLLLGCLVGFPLCLAVLFSPIALLDWISRRNDRRARRSKASSSPAPQSGVV